MFEVWSVDGVNVNCLCCVEGLTRWAIFEGEILNRRSCKRNNRNNNWVA